MVRETELERYALARQQMVDWQLRPRNITDGRVLKVMAQLPREGFIPPEHRAMAYEDRAGPIGKGQTISQPYMVALMTEKLHVEPHHRVLEIGTGSGYQTAVLGRLAKEVYTVERIAELSQEAREILDRLGIVNVRYKIDDGTGGWAEHAPFDRILVTAGAPEVPISLPIQLADGGLLVIPVGPERGQTLMRIRRTGKTFDKEPLVGCRFVKLIGQEGWPEEEK